MQAEPTPFGFRLRGRETDRQTDRQTDSDTERQTVTQRERITYTCKIIKEKEKTSWLCKLYTIQKVRFHFSRRGKDAA